MVRVASQNDFLITPFERSSDSISSRFPLINCHIPRVCYYCDYSISTLILPLFCNLINITYYFEAFKPIYSLPNVFTHSNKEISYKGSIKNFLCCELLFFLPHQSNKSLRKKQQRDTLLSDCLEIKGLGIRFAKESHHPQVTNSPVYIEVINFCGSQPCFPSREQRYYGLIELKPRSPVRKFFKFLQE